ncbi:MAG TPA: thioesterase family protein [Rhodopila sp.]|uniref:acyl-CoA thioesterase n=1 Tax=Rhodopila sp. TaxID=2480087 RepID=UPI002B998031|nr:thioesterase family protein [Rhodopila sp.]HVY13959.1 thioesterase family protein [Rhodopila sp.]
MNGVRREPARRADYRYFTSITTRWNDNDQMMHVNNAVYYMYFDTAQTTFYIQRGLLDMRRTSPYVVAESGCRHFTEISYPDVLTIGIRVAKLGTSSVRLEMGLFRNDADIASAESYFVHVFIDPGTRRPITIPDEARAEFAAIAIGADRH